MTNLTKLKELAERASVGEWSYSPCIEGQPFFGQVWDAAGDSLCVMDHMTGQANADGDYIAAANPKAILGLIERLRLAELKGLMDARSNVGLIEDIGRIKQQNEAMLNAVVKSRTALMVGRPSSKLASQKYTEAFAAIDAALEGGGNGRA